MNTHTIKSALFALLVAATAQVTHAMESQSNLKEPNYSELMRDSVDRALTTLEQLDYPAVSEAEKRRLPVNNPNFRILDRLCAERDPDIANEFYLVPSLNDKARLSQFAADYKTYFRAAYASRQQAKQPSPEQPIYEYTVHVTHDPNDNSNSCISFIIREKNHTPEDKH